MAVIYTDNFTDSNGTLIHNHTADTGQSYTTNAGMEIQANRVLFTDVTTKIAKIESMTLASEYVIEIDFYKFTNAGNIGVNFGVTTSTATDVGYGIYFRVLSTGSLNLVRVNQFGAFNLWTWNPGVADNTALSTVKIEVTTGGGAGRGMRIFYGGVEQHFNESTVSAGDSLYIRSFTAASSTTGHHIDRLEYNDSLPPPPSDAIPILTLPTVSGITATNVDVGFTTDQTDGTAYVLFDNSANTPAAATVSSDGQVSDTIVGSGVKSISYIDTQGLKDGRNYFAHIMHNNTFGDSNVLDTEIFKIPTLSTTYVQGSYAITGGATAPDSSTDTDTATMNVALESNITASLAEAGDTTAAAVSAPSSVAASLTEAGDTTSASVQNLIQVSASLAEAGDVVASSVQVLNQVAANQVEDGDTTAASINAQEAASVTASLTEAGDTTVAAMIVRDKRSVSANQTEAGDTTTANIVVLAARQITASTSEAGDTTSAAIVVPLPRNVTANQTEAGDATSASIVEELIVDAKHEMILTTENRIMLIKGAS